MQAASSPSPNQRWRQIEEVFQAAMEREPRERASFLESACGTDADLRREVESLLENCATGDPFLESALGEAAKSFLDRSAEAPAIAEGAVVEGYRVIRRLGLGGMSEVYLAEDIKLKRKVALKFLAQRFTRNNLLLERFKQEAQTLSGLNQANLLTVFAFCNHGERYFLVTEFVEGETLRQIISQGPLDRAKAIDIASQVATALSVAHQAGVIHRDVKPENIMLRRDGCVKVLDFGIAKLADLPERDPAAAELSSPGLLLGTPRYMSPEQVRAGSIDTRTDIFSLGAVLYEMLAGQPAFRGETQSDLIADILRSEPAPLKDKELQPVVARALAKDRHRRYQSVTELLTDLQRSDSKVRQSWTARRTLQSALGLLVVALIVIAALLIRQRVHPPRTSVPRSLAVLPFRNLRPDPASDFLGYSLADEVITKLGYLKALTVRPASAVNRYREGADLQRAASDLNADLLLTGTYLRDGDDLQITARLLDTNPQTVLWQKVLTVKYTNLLSVQDRVAQMIIQALELRLGPDEQARLKPEASMNHLAYEYYLRGVDLYAASDFTGAIAMLEKSAAIDGTYAPTWAHLGRAYTTNASLQFGGRDDYRRAEKAYDKAIALNPVFAEPRVYMANLLTDTGRVEESVPLLKGALESSPNDAEAHWELGYAYRYGGMLKESEAECELARKLDPEVKINSSALNTYLYLGEYEKFLNSLPSNDSPLLVFYHGLGSYYLHKESVAIGDFERAYELAPQLLQAQIGKAISDGLQGHPAEGVTLLWATERKLTEKGVFDPEGLYKVAQAYSVLGKPADAIRLLQRTVSGGFFCYQYFQNDPLLNSLRKEPGFNAVLTQARERNTQFERRFGSLTQQ